MALKRRTVFLCLGFVCMHGSWASAGGSGDCDGDGDLDMHDLGRLQLCFTGPIGEVDFLCACTDIDSEGDVDLDDFAGFIDAFTGADATIHTDLTGHALASYPFFDFVTTFNENETVQLTVDPTRFPTIAGQTVDVYVTANRAAIEWGLDPALVDVRGTPQEETFAGALVQDNVVQLVAPFELSSDGGSALGVGYDIVVDLDRNGLLSDGDIIDGRGDDAGMYIIPDLTASGPFAVSQGNHSGGSFLGQRVYYPSNIASMGELPLVTMSHGNGHDFQWYDYLGQHLASWGYVFMSHQNNTVPGIESASTTTLTNTDYFLGNLGTVQGGVLQGHVDRHTIVWIGHSRGGEGVVRAFTRLREGLFTPANFSDQDIVLVSSIAPNNALGAGSSEPGKTPYHLLWGAADGDISGNPSTQAQSFAIFERADGFRQSTYVHGADHNDFNCCGFDDFAGPSNTEIGRTEAQRVAKADYLTLIKHYVNGDPAAADFLYRQYESLKPISVASTTVVVNDFKRSLDAPDVVIDDFESGVGLGQSSSGSSVGFDVDNVTEGRMDDANTSYSWLTNDPMNGMSRSTSTLDDSSGVVFDFAAGKEAFIEWDVSEADGDFSDDKWLAFRACQGTRHPNTTAEFGDLNYTVTLRDGGGSESSINFGAYAGGIEEPYERSGSGSGVGWQNEFEIIRIPLADFLANGSGLDLSQISTIRFDFGGAFGSSRGRLGLDDLAIINERQPPGLTIDIPSPPEFLESGAVSAFGVTISTALGEEVVANSEQIHFRFNGGDYAVAALTPLGGAAYEATLPAGACGDLVEYFITAFGVGAGEVTFPETGGSDPLSADVIDVAFSDNFETDMGWTTENLGASSGFWERGVPVNDPGWDYDPPTDSDGSGQCYLTENVFGNTDIDGGSVRLTSPIIDVGGSSIAIQYDYYLYLTEVGGDDAIIVQITNPGSGVWTTVTEHDTHGALSWRTAAITQSDLDDAGVTLTGAMQIRFTVGDLSTASIVEAGLDAFKVFLGDCR